MQVIPVHFAVVPVVPHGYDVAVGPSQFQPTSIVGDKVGKSDGANDVGDADEDAEGAIVGAAVGVVGQLTMPCLKAHRASASDCCCVCKRKFMWACK